MTTLLWVAGAVVIGTAIVFSVRYVARNIGHFGDDFEEDLEQELQTRALRKSL